MTSPSQNLLKTFESLINHQKGILGSVLFDSTGQIVLGSQNILTSTIQLKDRAIDATDIAYVSAAISEKTKGKPLLKAIPPSLFFDDVFLLDEDYALFTLIIPTISYNFMIIAKKTLKIDLDLRETITTLVSDITSFILGS